MTLIMIFGFFGEFDMRKLLMIIHLKAGTGIEPVNSGFADRGLTTWLPRQLKSRRVPLLGGMSTWLNGTAIGRLIFRRIHSTSIGQRGNASRKALPYALLSIRLSRITMIPSSVFVRINRPTPCRSRSNVASMRCATLVMVL